MSWPKRGPPSREQDAHVHIFCCYFYNCFAYPLVFAHSLHMFFQPLILPGCQVHPNADMRRDDLSYPPGM